MEQNNIHKLIAHMTLEEKASLCSGRDNWYTKPIERLDIPTVRTSDGPHGLRLQDGETNSLDEARAGKAVCFPAACATATSFDRQLIRRMGEALGRECQAADVQVLLGPGVNIKRSPLCGRNFEYFSEDPLLSGELGAAFVEGVQGEGVGTSLKHFFANNQEHRRMDSSSEMDERTMREIYLAAFETVVQKAQPWTVMASYNKIAGVYSTENKQYLNTVLRDEWGFEGLVMSDWGATHNRAKAVEAGCDLTMPCATATDNKLVEAVQNGTLAEATLDACCARVIELALRGRECRQEGVAFEYESDHSLAQEIAAQSMVLLKNERGLLPLAKAARVAFIGDFAEKPRYQGGGSSHVNSSKVVGALDAARQAGLDVSYTPGYSASGEAPEETLIAKAVEEALKAEVAVVFAGLTEAMESEGVDRRHMGMPEAHNALIEAVCAAQPNTVVVLHNGAPVEMPWVNRPAAVLEAYLGGQAVGKATLDVLYGEVNPSGRLAETFPLKLEDNPSYLYYFGEAGEVQYSERMFVGYRYYTSKNAPVLFPFGHGLSYTSFQYKSLTLDKTEMGENDTLTATVQVTNTGARAGKVVVQLYVAPPKGEMLRPVRELKGFEKLELDAGETGTAAFTLGRRAFAHWNPIEGGWCVESGAYTIQIGENARDIVLQQPIQVNAKPLRIAASYNDATPIGEFARHPLGKVFIEENLAYMLDGMAKAGFVPGAMLQAMGIQPGARVSLDMLAAMAQHSGSSAAGGDGMAVFLTQSVSVLSSFVPQEDMLSFEQLLYQMNQTEE